MQTQTYQETIEQLNIQKLQLELETQKLQNEYFKRQNLSLKLNLTISEAAFYSGIGETTLRKYISQNQHSDIITRVYTKTMIYRAALEKELAEGDLRDFCEYN